MQFAIYCLDKPDSTAVRAQARAAHLEYVDRHADKIVLAGPVLSDDGKDMIGSLLIMEFPDKAAAERFTQEDPYRKAGLFKSVEIRPFRKVRPQG